MRIVILVRMIMICRLETNAVYIILVLSVQCDIMGMEGHIAMHVLIAPALPYYRVWAILSTVLQTLLCTSTVKEKCPFAALYMSTPQMFLFYYLNNLYCFLSMCFASIESH